MWESGHTATVKIENTGNTVIKNWALLFRYESGIENVWNAIIAESGENSYLIKNTKENQRYYLKKILMVKLILSPISQRNTTILQFKQCIKKEALLLRKMQKPFPLRPKRPVVQLLLIIVYHKINLLSTIILCRNRKKMQMFRPKMY